MKKCIYSILIVLMLLIIAFLIQIIIWGSNLWNSNLELISEESFNSEAINEILVNTKSSTIKIYESEDDSFKFKLYSNKLNDMLNISSMEGKLNVSYENSCSIFCFKKSYLEVYLPKNYEENIKIKVTSGNIEASKEMKFKNADITSTSGDIKITNIISENLSVESTSGDININNISADYFNAKATSGDIEINDINSKKVTINTTSGDIEINKINAQLSSVESTSGDITIEEATDIELATTSGDIRGNNLSNSDIKTTSGSIYVKKVIGLVNYVSISGNIKVDLFLPTADSNFKATSGSINITMDENSNAVFDANSTSGKIKHPVKLNEGLYIIKSKTVSGNITIK